MEKASSFVREIASNIRLQTKELSAIMQPLPIETLHDLLLTSVGQKSDWASECIYDTILSQSNDHGNSHEMKRGSASISVVMHLINLLEEGRFRRVRAAVQEICIFRNFGMFPSQYRLDILRIALLSHIGRDMREPEMLDTIEQKCQDIVIEQGFSPHLHIYTDFVYLIIAYLLRIHGCRQRGLQHIRIDWIRRLVSSHSRDAIPTLPFVWANQQFALWCSSSGRYDEASVIAEKVTELIVTMSVMGEDLDDDAKRYLQLHRTYVSKPMMPPTVENLYPAQSDAKLFQVVKECLWQAPLSTYQSNSCAGSHL